jgi:hypothetical protein
MKTIRGVIHWGCFFVLSIFIFAFGTKTFAQTDGSDTVPVVTIQATDPIAITYQPGNSDDSPFEPLGKLGVFTVFRRGNTNLTLNVYYQIGGTASNGVDYAQISNWVTIPAGATSNSISILPLVNRPSPSIIKTVVLQLAPSPMLNPVNFEIGVPSNAVVYIESTNVPPFSLLNIDSPKEGSVFYTPTNIPIAAWISESVLATNVEFFAGTNDLGGAIAGLSAIGFGTDYFLTWTNPLAGDYALTAVATDYFGTSRTSAPVNIRVQTGPAATHGYITAVLRSECTDSPTPPPPVGGTRVGSDYVIMTVADADPTDWTNAQRLVTDAIFKSLMPLYCALPKTGCVTDSVQWNIITYGTNGNPMTSGCAASGCQSHSCEAVPPPTNLPPLVSIFVPTNGAVFFVSFVSTNVETGITNVETDIELLAEASDPNGTVTNVEFFAGTNDLGASTPLVLDPPGVNGVTGPVYFIYWRNPSLGNYALTALATDDYGLSATSAPINITVLPSPPPTNQPPVVRIGPPTNDATFFAPVDVPIYATASASSGTASVEFFADGQDLGPGALEGCITPAGNCVGCPPPVLTCTYSLVWSNAPVGAWALTAVATDNGGLNATSAPVAVSVIQSPPTNPIVVRIISPPNGAVFRAPINLPLFAFFTYPHGPGDWASVGFYDGTNFLGLAQPVSRPTPIPLTPGGPTPSPIPVPPTALSTNICELVWSNAPVGNHVLTAQAIVGNSNNAAILRLVSAPVNIAILPPLPPPTNRPPIVSIVASDPVAIEGTNSWTWRGETNSPPTWAAWPTAIRCPFTNSGPKDAIFTVHRFGSTNNDLTVSYDVGGTASNGMDYVELPGSVTIPAGQRDALITIVPIDDGPPDINKTVILALTPSTNIPPDYVPGFPRRAAAVIIDSHGPHPVTGMLPGKYFHLVAPGPDAAWFCIEYSTNLVNWTPVCTNQVVNGSIDFVDPNAADSPGRFYRILPLTNAP